MACGNSFYPWDGSKLRESFFEKRNFARIRVARLAESNIEEHGLAGIETGVEVKHVEQALDEQARADQKAKAESGFADYQGMVQAIAPAAGGHGSPQSRSVAGSERHFPGWTIQNQGGGREKTANANT
jgi:hypothetical protein